MTLTFNKREVLDKKIKKELGWLLPELLEAGWTVVSSVYSSRYFGNWQVCISRGEESLQLVKDRNQYSVDSGSGFAEMQAAEIQGAFGSWDEFASVVFRYAVLPK